MKSTHRLLPWQGLVGAVVGALLLLSSGASLAHDPEDVIKGEGRLKNGFTEGGELEAKRARNTGKGMPSIRGPFPETFGLEFIGQVTNAELGATRLVGTGASFLSDIWGWTSPVTGDEYALVGTSSGMAFVRITDYDAPDETKDTPVFLGIIPTTNPNTLLNFWWDVKVYNGYVYYTTEVRDAGVAIFELARLDALTDPPPDGILTADARFDGSAGQYRAAHNISINEETGFAYLTGVTLDPELDSDEPVWILDLRNGPLTPVEVGSISFLDGLEIDSHDAQIVSYIGPDTDYSNREIAFVAAGLNLQLGIYDVTNKADIVEISATTYPGASFTHQGWLSEDHRYFFMGDEEDELFGISDPQNPDLPDTTRTYVFDVTDLDAPNLHCTFDAPYAAIDHNMFVKGHYLYQANYTSGFTVWDISGMDPALPNCGMVEAGHMDTEPRLPNNHMNHNINIFVGPWGIFPYFDSGKIIVSDGLNGLIIAKLAP